MHACTHTHTHTHTCSHCLQVATRESQMWLELVLAISDEYLASLDGLFLENLKVDYNITSLGRLKGHTHTLTIMWVVKEFVPLFFISLRTESLLPPSSEH